MTPWERLVSEAEHFLKQHARREEAKRRHPASGDRPPKEEP